MGPFSTAGVTDMHHKRAHRVAQLLKHELSALTVNGLRDPRVGLVTITEVRLSDDLRSAQVFVSVLGDEAARKATLAGLTAAAGFLRHEATHNLQLRFAPTLHFHYDDSLARAQRLDALLGAAARGEVETPVAGDGGEMPPVDTGRQQRTLAGPPAPPDEKPAQRRLSKRTRRNKTGRIKKLTRG